MGSGKDETKILKFIQEHLKREGTPVNPLIPEKREHGGSTVVGAPTFQFRLRVPVYTKYPDRWVVNLSFLGWNNMSDSRRREHGSLFKPGSVTTET